METRPVQARGGCVSHRHFADGARLRAWKGACCLEGTPPTELTEQTVVLFVTDSHQSTVSKHPLKMSVWEPCLCANVLFIKILSSVILKKVLNEIRTV